MRFPRTWRDVIHLLDTTVETKIKHILVTIAVGFGVSSLVFYMVESNGNRDLLREQRANDAQNYASALRVYDTQVTQIAQCNARFDGRQAARVLFTSQNNTLRTILQIADDANPNPTSPVVMSLFDELDHQDERIAAQYPPDEVNTCPPLPPLPVVPRSLAGDAEDQTNDRLTVPTTTPTSSP